MVWLEYYIARNLYPENGLNISNVFRLLFPYVDEYIPVVPVVKDTKVNGIKTRRVDVVQKVVTEKIETKKIETKKTETKKIETKKIEAKKIDAKKTETKKTETKKTETKKIDTKKIVTKKSETTKKLPPKKKKISAIRSASKFNNTDPGIAHTVAEIASDAANNTLIEPNATVLPPAVSISSKNSDTSTVSTGSIEQKLSEMISPIKTIAQISTDQMGKFLFVFRIIFNWMFIVFMILFIIR